MARRPGEDIAVNRIVAASVRRAVLCAPALMLSQSLSAQVLEEVIVTAQKREQLLQDVGISVTAFSDEQLRQLGLTNTLQLGSQTPGLLVTDTNGGTTTAFTLRGSGQLDFGDHQEPPVAVYVDGAYNSFLGGVGFRFFDVERIEVLRGPQGTLFGRNATGGVVQLISNKPTEEFEGYVSASAGEYALLRLEAGISGPISERVRGRLSLYHESSDGYQENRIGPDLNEINNNSGRAQLQFLPSDDVEFLLSGQWNIDDNTAQGYDIVAAMTDSFAFGPIDGGTGDGLVKRPPSDATYASFCNNFFFVSPPPGSSNCFGFAEPKDGVHKVANDLDTHFDREVYDVTGTLTWRFGDARLISITDYKSFDKDYLEDSDSSPLSLMIFDQKVDATQFSQEVRLEGEADRLNWVAGAYYLDIDGDYDAGVDVTNTLAVALRNVYNLETRSWAVFAQTDFQLTERWGLITGLRWTEDEKDMNLRTSCVEVIPDICNIAFSGLVQVDGLPPVSRDEGDWSGTLRLEFEPNDDWLLYAGVTRGQKAGGFNAGAVTFFTPDQVEFDGEVLTNYEVGIKATLFGGTTRISANAFHYDYDNFQAFYQLGASLIVFNADAEVNGGEIELVTQPWDGWEFLLGASLLDATEKGLEYAGVTKDRPMPNAPDITLNGLARYGWSMFSGTMTAQVDFRYVDDRSLNAIDHPALQAESYSVTNARLSYTTEDRRWEGALFVNNVADEDFFHTMFDISTLTGSLQRIPGAPRWFGAELRYNW
jgi:iron complex outermembrane receptor protein